MSDVDAVLARARRPGRFVATRRFTLARDKAIQKMREYVLRTREQYVLELVQAAVLGGARFVAVEVRGKRETVGWLGGNGYSASELESLFDHLFVDQAARETRHIQQLAVGVNALLQEGTGAVTVESGNGDVATRLSLTAQGEVQCGEVPPFSGTYVSSTVPTTWWSRGRMVDPRRVYASLIEKAGWCPVPLLFNDGAVFGYTGRTPPRPLGPRRVQVLGPEPPPPGVAPDSFTPTGRLGVVIGGVLIRDQKDSPWVGALRMTVHDDALRKTADMGDIVEDDAWADLLIATRPLLERARERHGLSWEPPPLPRPVRAARPGVDVPKAVSDPPTTVNQVAPRRDLPLGALYEMTPGEPLFWVDDAAALTLGPLLAPHRFPWRVLRLTPHNAEAIEALDLPVRLSRLVGASEVAFVRGVVERGGGDPRVEVELAGARAVVHLPTHPPRRWDPPGEGDAILTLIDGFVGELLSSPVDLGGCSVEIHLSASPLSAEEIAALALTACGVAAARSPILAARLILAHARPHLHHDGVALRLDVRWPHGWAGVHETLLDTPLTEQEPPLTLRRWLAALDGDGDPIRVPDLRPFAALEVRLGAGALVGPSAGDPLVLLARTPGGWRSVRANDAPPLGTVELLALYPTPALPDAPSGFRRQPGPVPGLVFWVADGAPQEPPSAAYHTMRDALRLAWATAEPRDQAWILLSSVRLAAVHGALSEVRLPTAPHGTVPAITVVRGGGPPLAARDGVLVDLPTWIPVDLPLARALESAADGRLYLVLDDAPALWDTPDPQAWLVRVVVTTPNVRGWLGLRRTFDPTPAILKVQGLTTSLWTPLVERLPAHGLLHVGPDGAPVAEVVLAGLALYRDLRDGLAQGRFVGDDLVAARAHAAAAVAQGARLGLDSSILRDLVPFAAGGALRLPELLRPALALDEERGTALRQAVAAGFRAVGPERRVRVLQGVGHTVVHFDPQQGVTVEVDDARPRVQAAERGDVDAALLLAVEIGLALRESMPGLDLGGWLRGALGALAIRA